MSMYKTFGTEKSLEIEGVWTNYGEFRVKIAHAGGANKAFLTYGEQVMKPFRRAIDSGSFPRERMEALLFDVYAKHVVKGWEVNQGTDGEDRFVPGIEGPDGDVIPFNTENVIQTFRMLPSLFYDIKDIAEGIAAYRQMDLEDEAGNS